MAPQIIKNEKSSKMKISKKYRENPQILEIVHSLDHIFAILRYLNEVFEF